MTIQGADMHELLQKKIPVSSAAKILFRKGKTLNCYAAPTLLRSFKENEMSILNI